jgi:pantetheine-phosphate adenylyltransferase
LSGLTAAFCHQHGSGVIVRGVRNPADLRQECQLAAMNDELGITTLLVPARPALAAVSSTAVRALNFRFGDAAYPITGPASSAPRRPATT